MCFLVNAAFSPELAFQLESLCMNEKNRLDRLHSNKSVTLTLVSKQVHEAVLVIGLM